MDDTEYIRVYTGLESNVMLLQEFFEKEKITNSTRNDYEAGLRGGFGGGFPGQVQLFVHRDQYDKALKIVRNTFPGEEVDERQN